MEQVDGGLHVVRACGFSDGMHGQHGVANVDGADTQLGEHGADGRATSPGGRMSASKTNNDLLGLTCRS